MPEIAEVETVRKTLKNKIINKKIIDIKIIYPKIIESYSLPLNKIINEIIIDIKRIGKWLLFETDNYYLLSHLRMEGKYFIKDKDEEIIKHEHIIFYLNDNSTLRYHDTRKFGRMILTKKEDLNKLECIKKQGYEPFDDKLTAVYLKEKLTNKKLPIKTILLDQTIISGLGNIYADEVLFYAKINPLKRGSELNNQELTNIINSSKIIIKRAIELGGTTIKSYTSSLGVTGRFQNELAVHTKDICPECKNIILTKKINGRSTYYCPNCQK